MEWSMAHSQNAQRGSVEGVVDPRFNAIADFDLDVLHVMVLERFARDAGVLLAQLQADNRAIFAYSVRPCQA